MREIKTWLETTGEPVAKTAFIPGESKPMPFIVYLDKTDHDGADDKNLFCTHNVTVERYSLDGEGDESIRDLLDAEGIKYTEEQTWLDDEQCFMTTFDFNFTE